MNKNLDLYVYRKSKKLFCQEKNKQKTPLPDISPNRTKNAENELNNKTPD